MKIGVEMYSFSDNTMQNADVLKNQVFKSLRLLTDPQVVIDPLNKL